MDVALNILLKVVHTQLGAIHVCNPTYSGGRDQEICSLKPALANNSWDPILKMPNTIKGLVEWLKVSLASVRPWVQTPVLQKKSLSDSNPRIYSL
jgi:hypothetical protein